MDNQRLEGMRRDMDEVKLDALVLRLPENVLLLSGHWPMIGWSFLVFPAQGTPTLVCPHCDTREAGDELWEAERRTFEFGVLSAGDPFEAVAAHLRDVATGKGWRRVGYEGSFETAAPPWNAGEVAIPAGITAGMLRSVFGDNTLVDATDLLMAQRAIKTDAEAEQLRRVNEISAMGLGAFAEAVAPGVTGVELVTVVESAIMREGTGYRGARRVRAFAQVATGPGETAIGYRPMEISSKRPMAEGDIALLELGVVADGFWSDRTRARVAGAADDRVATLYDTVRLAQQSAIEVARPGVTAGQVDEAARSVIRDAGHGDAFIHVTGHGLGLRYHEPSPTLMPGSDESLRPGMVSSVEPGIYIDGVGGLRVEDNILVTEDGAEVLGPAPKELT